MRALAEQISPLVPGGLFPLGTDGFGRSETRPHLRRHFEVDAEAITVAALYQLSKCGQVEAKCVAGAIKDLGIDPEKVNPLRAYDPLTGRSSSTRHEGLESADAVRLDD